MGLFDRFLKAGRDSPDASGSTAEQARQDAARLLEEGMLLEQDGKMEDALQRYDSAILLVPELARAHFNRGNILLDRGDAAQALEAFAKAVEYKPDSAAAYYNMGNAHVLAGDAKAAVGRYRKAIELKPDFADAHAALGGRLEELGNVEEAMSSYRRALEIQPAYVEVNHALANILLSDGRLDEAAAIYRKALEIQPDSVVAHYHLGVVLYELRQYDQALASYRRALALRPDYAEAYGSMGILLHDVGKLDEAVASYRRALELKGDWIEVHGNLGNALKDLKQLDEAVMSYRRVLEMRPDDAKAYNNLGAVLNDLGRIEEAVQNYRRALDIDPDFVTANSSLLFAYNYLADQSAPMLLAEARRYGELVARQTRSPVVLKNTPDAGRCLRVGVVSGDFRAHAVGYFVEGVLAALKASTSGRLELFAYSSFSSNDEVTKRIKAQFHHWCWAMDLSDELLAQRIRDDAIDILIDLSGHTAHNRLPLFARKPAPVQVTWLGYLATTGVAAIDYLIADNWTLPVSEEVNFTETIWRLPESYLCFAPPVDDVAVGPLPALSNGYVTFGSFNNLTKMNNTVVELWSRVLSAMPGSKLFLKAPQLKEISIRQSVVERFAAHGIDSGRLILEGPVPRAEYLLPFQRVDIALDPFPYPGITTSVESLWMGVPILTLAGQSFLSRQGIGLLMNVGLPEWIVTDPDAYVACAVAHASDLKGLAALRARLRQQVLVSPTFDAPRFARHFEIALRGMWEKWCESQVGLRSAAFADLAGAARVEGGAAGESDSIVSRSRLVTASFSDKGLMKLHIGGKETKAGWKILNALSFEGVDFVGNVSDLSIFPDACCEKVYASHVMEHVGQRDFLSTLKGIRRILCEGGELYFSVPDLEVLCRLFISPELDSAQRFHVMRMMFGGQTDDYDFHYIGLTNEFMGDYFSMAGFSSVKRVGSFGLFHDTSDYRPYGVPISLNLIAIK